MVKAGKVAWLKRAIGYGRTQGLVAGAVAMFVFLGVFGMLVMTDPMNFQSERVVTVQNWECQRWTFDWDAGTKICLNVIPINQVYTRTYVNLPILGLYLMFAYWAWTAVFLGLWGMSYKRADKDLARNLTIYGEEQVFSTDLYGLDTKCRCKKVKCKCSNKEEA